MKISQHITQKMQVLLFITEHGPVRVHDLNKFGVENYINYPQRLKNILINDELVERLHLNDPNTVEQYQYISTQQFKQWRKDII